MHLSIAQICVTDTLRKSQRALVNDIVTLGYIYSLKSEKIGSFARCTVGWEMERFGVTANGKRQIQVENFSQQKMRR